MRLNLRNFLRHLHESQNLANAAAGGKTPFGAGTGRTPARPGGATPGHMSVRHTRTPNYGGATPAPFAPSAVPTPAGYPIPPQTPYGYQTPSHHAPNFLPQAPPEAPPGMNPARAAMIQNGGGSWGQGSSSWS